MSAWPTVALTALVLTASSFAPHPPPEADEAPGLRADPDTVITVHVAQDRGSAPTGLLGVNHHYNADGYHLWDPATDAADPAAVRGAELAGITSMRFPGGTVANTYDWKRAVGPTHGCQVVGPHADHPATLLTRGLAFGPDEYMRFLEQIDADPFVMVPFVTETPGDAADWVEYMNSPSGTAQNPNGGEDWAEVRAANGHPAPYRVQWWEIGNEQHHGPSRYWMSADDRTALRQYANGGSLAVTGENLGKDCSHTAAGTPSDGTAGQVFEVLYPPVAPASVTVVADGHVWTRVDDLSDSGADDRVFTVDAGRGRVHFGDGMHGAVPPAGSTVKASYRSVHEGFFAFARRMKEVDPSIHVCSSWGTVDFDPVAGDRDYDCLTAHAISLLQWPGNPDGTAHPAIDGHDLAMVKADGLVRGVGRLLDSLPRSVPLVLSEFLGLHGNDRAFVGWPRSESQAVFQATLWAAWMRMHIRRGTGDDFLWSADRGVLGAAPDFTFSADAVTRQALSPMFSAGGRLVATSVAGNPVRRPPSLPASYRGLSVTATRASGVLWLLVVNRLPGQAVTARVRLDGGTSTGALEARIVRSLSFHAQNTPEDPQQVFLDVGNRSIGRAAFDQTFPPASTTVLRVGLR